MVRRLRCISVLLQQVDSIHCSPLKPLLSLDCKHGLTMMVIVPQIELHLNIFLEELKNHIANTTISRMFIKIVHYHPRTCKSHMYNDILTDANWSHIILVHFTVVSTLS